VPAQAGKAGEIGIVLPGSKNRLVLQLVGQAVEAGQVKAGLQRRLVSRKAIGLPA
jgi:hypothetical protein